MYINTTYYSRCIDTLEKAHGLLIQANTESIDYEIYRSACIKEFEIILEQSGKLLRKVLKRFFHSSKAVDGLYFKDLFRNAVKYGLMDDETCNRWLQYRDNRNSTAHDYDVNFAEETLLLLSSFIIDSKQLSNIIEQHTIDEAEE